MDKILTIITACLFTFSSMYLQAAPTDDAPPAQMQKDKVPDSTSNGNYLEPQQDENGATQNTTSKHKKKDSRPTNIEKSKKVTDPPEKGGVNVN